MLVAPSNLLSLSKSAFRYTLSFIVCLVSVTESVYCLQGKVQAESYGYDNKQDRWGVGEAGPSLENCNQIQTSSGLFYTLKTPETFVKDPRELLFLWVVCTDAYSCRIKTKAGDEF